MQSKIICSLINTRTQPYLKLAMKNFSTLRTTGKSSAYIDSQTHPHLNGKMGCSVEQSKPLVLLFPFLGASTNVIKKYASIYEKNGCNVLSFPIQLKEFLWPKLGLKNSYLLLTNLERRISASNEQIIVHSMSIGCYFYALMMCVMKENPQKFSKIRSNICGQIVDSPVVGTLNEMAIGVSKMVTSADAARSLFYGLCQFYFMFSKPYTVDYFNESIEVFKHNSPTAPSLLLKADKDEMALPEAFQDLVEAWCIRNDDVTFKVFENSYHIGILKTHPEEYHDLIKKVVDKAFLKSNL